MILWQRKKRAQTIIVEKFFTLKWSFSTQKIHFLIHVQVSILTWIISLTFHIYAVKWSFKVDTFFWKGYRDLILAFPCNLTRHETFLKDKLCANIIKRLQHVSNQTQSFSYKSNKVWSPWRKEIYFANFECTFQVLRKDKCHF